MEDLDEVRRRMAKRKMDRTYQKVLTDKQFNRLYRFALTTMCLCVMVLGIASYAKQNPEIQNYLRTNFNFSQATGWFETNVLSMIPFFDRPQATQSVSGDIIYNQVGDKLYQGNDTKLNAVNSGIVTNVQKDSITVNQDNGIQVIYGNLSDIQVGLYDHIQKGEMLAMYEASFSMQFFKGEEIISYEQALQEN
jgi:Peptidase family M23.